MAFQVKIRKMTENSDCIGNSLDLLNKFELILDGDPNIDEIGFIHPSQFSMLSKECEDSKKTGVDDKNLNFNDSNFWVRNHKLGISTRVLLPLFKAARNAFMAAIKEYAEVSQQSHDSPCLYLHSAHSIESEAMKHSKALLLLSCDFSTAWNFRKLILSKRQPLHIYKDELYLSALVLSYSPKSEQAWSHRRWMIKFVIQELSTPLELIEKESELVERTAERSKMNYRAWSHRCWLVSYMSKEQVLLELKKTRKWGESHVADNCCFHYRRPSILSDHLKTSQWQQLLLKLLVDPNSEPVFSSDFNYLFKDELDWDEALIKLYIGREALWLHRRFLSTCWLKQLASDPCLENELLSFVDHELNLIKFCLIIPDNDFDDFQAQALHAATYLLWLKKEFPTVDIEEKLKATSLRNVLHDICPERWSLWDYLLDSKTL